MKTVIGILGLPVRRDNKFLLTKRHAPKYPVWHNKWQLAGGGLEFGEIPEETLIREMWEELRVKPTILHPLPIAKSITWYAKETKFKKDTQVLLLTYLISIGNQEPDLSHDPEKETSDYCWFNLDEAKQLDCLPLTLEIVKEANDIVRTNGILKKHA